MPVIENQDPSGGKLGIEFYAFRGGLKENTRAFCRERNGKFFHYREIMDWSELEWEGKHPDTNPESIFKLVGGYCNAGDKDERCQHVLIAVSEVVVTQEDLQRIRKKGYWKPSN